MLSDIKGIFVASLLLEPSNLMTNSFSTLCIGKKFT